MNFLMCDRESLDQKVYSFIGRITIFAGLWCSHFYYGNKMKKLIHGVGMNDADYAVNPSTNGKRKMCQFYQTWAGMLARCYSPKAQVKSPTYIGCTVCKEWHSFMAFKAWMVKQSWEGKELDKDIILTGNKIYSPETCIFVLSQINSLLADSGASRGKWPIGVHWHIRKQKFMAECQTNGKTKYLGYFTDQHEAHRAWQAFKIKVIEQAATSQEDAILVAALSRIAAKIQSNLDKNIETVNYV